MDEYEEEEKELRRDEKIHLKAQSEPVEKQEFMKGSNSDHVQEDSADEEFQTLDEDEMIGVAQKCFITIAKYMLQNKTTMLTLYQSVAFEKEVEGELTQLISPIHFIEGIRQLGIQEFDNLEYACLVKVLSINDEEKYIKLQDLIQIMEDYGINEEGAEGEAEEIKDEEEIPEEEVSEKDAPQPHKSLNSDDRSQASRAKQNKGLRNLDYESLDGESMIIMMNLTDYLLTTRMPLYELFSEAIYKQFVKTKTKQKAVDLMNATDFFQILYQVELKETEKLHLNLMQFLCLDPNYLEKIFVKKLKKAIEEFATNDNLRGVARAYFEQNMSEKPSSRSNQFENPPPEKKIGKKHVQDQKGKPPPL